MKKNIYYFNIILLIIPAIFTSFFYGKIVVVNSICLYTLFFTIIILLLKQKNNLSEYLPFWIFYFLNIVIFVRGIFDLKSYQDQISFFSNMIFITLLYPLYIILIRQYNIIKILKSILYIGFPLSIITYFFKPSDGFLSFQHNISFIYFFVLLIPFLKNKWKIIIILIVIIGVTYDITRRSFLINSFVSIFILILYYIFSLKFLKKIAKYSLIILSISPIIFLILGLFGIFNVFKISEDSGIVLKGSGFERDALVDSRTEIYYDVFSELSNQNSYILGLGGNGKTPTTLSDISNDYFLTYKEGRRGTESGMLNYFQWGGCLTAFSYFILLFYASYLAIFKSNNILHLLLGIFLSFKILYSFIEDQIATNLATFYIMAMIGFCYNRKIREMDNLTIKRMVSNVFS